MFFVKNKKANCRGSGSSKLRQLGRGNQCCIRRQTRAIKYLLEQSLMSQGEPGDARNGHSNILALPSHRVEATNFCHELSQIKFVLIRAHNSWPIFGAGILRFAALCRRTRSMTRGSLINVCNWRVLSRPKKLRCRASFLSTNGSLK
jgi:hypothetical protein